MSRHGKGSPGYTLIELMIVLVVLGLALAMGAPYMGGYLRSKQLQDSVESMSARFELARSRAVSERNPYHVLLNSPNDGEYRILDDDDGDGNVDIGETVLGPFALPTGVTIASIDLLGGGGIEFRPSGMLRAGQGGSITLADSKNRAKMLEVYASGLTQIKTCAAP
jgi:prepilin-type N-terminal cleavage/methylation domain-containing protein